MFGSSTLNEEAGAPLEGQSRECELLWWVAMGEVGVGGPEGREVSMSRGDERHRRMA